MTEKEISKSRNFFDTSWEGKQVLIQFGTLFEIDVKKLFQPLKEFVPVLFVFTCKLD